MIIYAHRGIDMDRSEKLSESSLAAFRWSAERGFGIEVDLQLTRDQAFLIAHDSTVERWTNGRSKVLWSSLGSEEVTKLSANFGPVCWFLQILALMQEFPALQVAIHLKGVNQTGPFVKKLTDVLKAHVQYFSRLLLFDLKSEIAVTLLRALPGIGIAPSVSDEYDVARFQASTHGTLMSLDDAFEQGRVFNWLWLDEWDRSGANESLKSLYNDDVFSKIRKKGLKVAIVSPELHKNEGHPDAQSDAAIQMRWDEIIRFKPDAICTDYPARLLMALKSC
jgi:glycerophosphoryl diester phosphodiesterase